MIAHTRWAVWALLLAISGFIATGLTAQEPVGDPPPAAEDGGLPQREDAAVDEPPRELTIYIPYTKLRELFEREGRGVFLPYEEFQALWKAARAEKSPTPDPRPPVGALIAEIDCRANVEKDVVHVVAHLQIEVLAEGWTEVPLRLADAAILSATLDGEPARLVFAPDVGYKLLIENPTGEPRKAELALEFAKAFIKAPGQNSVSFEAPQAPVSRWRLAIPESGVKVDIQPLIAASEAPLEDVAAGEHPSDNNPSDIVDPPGGGSALNAQAPDENAVAAQDPQPAPPEETVILAFVGAAPTVRFDWATKAEGATGLEALATVQAQQEVFLDEGVVRSRVTLSYDISRAELGQLRVEVPADYKVVNVFDPNVRQWDVTVEGEVQRIAAQLFQPVRGAQNVVVEMERYYDETGAAEVHAPLVRALDVGRQQGFVVVRPAAGLLAEAGAATGLSQVDFAELPGGLSGGAWTLAYRYVALPYDLTLAVEKVTPRLRSQELVEAYLEPERLTLDMLAIYTIERAGVFQLELDVPAGYQVLQVRGQDAADTQAAAVDSHRLEGENSTRLVVNLARKAEGRIGLFVELEKRLDDANLLAPTGQASQVPLALPRVAAGSVEQTSGRLVLYAPESLRVNPTQQEGLRAISVTEAFAEMPSCRGERFGGTRPVLAFAYTPAPVQLAISAERRQPYVSVGQLLTARLEPGVVKYEAAFRYDVRYSGVKSLRIDVPAALAGEIRNQTPSVRETTIDPPPEDLDEGYVAWSLTGETEFLGEATIALAWETPLAKLEVGGSVDVPLPVLRPRGADRAWGQIALVKTETLDVQPKEGHSGLRPIDPQQDLMAGASVHDAARAFEFHDDWSLTVEATQYKLEEVKRTSIERSVVRMVVTRSDRLAVQALYRVRSMHQRLGVVFPAGAEFDSEPARINGLPVPLERGDADEFFVPLSGQSAETPVVLELRYTLPGSASRLDVPQFADDPAVQKVYLCAYLPEEQTLLGVRGPWTDELLRSWSKVNPGAYQPPPNDPQLVAWVTEGLNVTGNPAETFQTAGERYVFSALRPEAPPNGSLRMTTLDETLLNVLLFGSLAVVGLVLLRVKPTGQLVAMAAIVIGLVLCGVFLPTFSLQIFDAELLAALFAVVVLWGAWHVVRWQPWRRWSLPIAAVAAAGAASATATSATPAAVEAKPSESPPGDAAPSPFAAEDDRGNESHGAERSSEPKSDDGTEGGQDHA